MTQYARPDEDITVGGWENESSGSSLYSSIDESSPSDTDYILGKDEDECVIGLSDLVDPNVHTDHVIKVRAKVGIGSCTGWWYLKQGTTTIKSGVFNSTSFATSEVTLSSAEAATITDYEDLRFHFKACSNSVYSTYISWAEFSVPEVVTSAPPTSLAPTTVDATTVAPTTEAPTTLPTTLAPTTIVPTTVLPTTVAPTSLAPTTEAPTTVAPTTVAPTTLSPTSLAPTTKVHTTLAPTTVASTTVLPTTVLPTSLPPTTILPTTLAPTTIVTTTQVTTVAPTTAKPTTIVPTTLAPTTEPPMCVRYFSSLINAPLYADSLLPAEVEQTSLITKEIMLNGDLCR
jgi:hypothetical protein